MKKTARNAAFEALLQMETKQGYSNLVLDQTLTRYGLSPQERGLATTLFYGVLERQLTLDAYLKSCLQQPDRKLERKTQIVLRCGAYQLLYLDKIPANACVNEAVETIRGAGKAAYTGFVNGVLRTLIRKKEQLSLPTGEDPAALSIRHSVPVPLIEMWQKAYGTDVAVKMLEAFSARPETYLRVNTEKTDSKALQAVLEKEGVACVGSEKLPDVLVTRSMAVRQSAAFAQGLFHVQDLSAQLICHLLAPAPGEAVLDVCAAPGGKSFTMAQLMQGRGCVTALELHGARAALIRQGADRLGLETIQEMQADATALSAMDLPQMDKVLCDVPCSGYGVIRRKPEIRYKPLTDAAELPELQYRILVQGAEKVKRGGLLCYATCTLHPAENEDVANRFLSAHSKFEPAPLSLPDWIVPREKEPDHMLTMLPFAGGSDGFFTAMFRRVQ